MTRDASLIGVFSAEAGEAPPSWHEPIPGKVEHRGGSRKGHPNVGGPRPNAGRPSLPRLTADEAKALLRELAPDARTPAEYARALGCRPERVREALRGGCTVATAERWRAAIQPIGLEEGFRPDRPSSSRRRYRHGPQVTSTPDAV